MTSLNSTFSIAALALSVTLATPAIAADSAWQPDRPINIIVPWSAGGSTDQITRLVAPMLEEELGVPVVVVNQTGASGSIGTKAALDAPRDGYTWTANAIADTGVYAVTGLIEDTSMDDYRLYLSVANVPVLSVNHETAYETFADALHAMGGSEPFTIATAGVNSSGGMALAALQAATENELNARQIAYDGGNPAVLAAASGEAIATTQLAADQSQMIKGGKLRPLVAFAAQAVEMDGVPPIPPITDTLPEMTVAPKHFGIFIPKGAPQEVYDTMDALWQKVVMDNDAIRAYARDRGAIYDPAFGDEARTKAAPSVIAEACAKVDAGIAAIDPATIGIDCKTRTLTK
ncbi:MAG: tripartite tricarboxylate transporter substrate-binding protein [Devosia sp.]